MKKTQLFAGLLLCGVLVFATPTAQAQSDDLASMLATIQQLQERIVELQAQLQAMRGEVREVREEIRQTWREGMRGEEVRRAQELLATDPEIYPEGLATGFFGGLTRSALMRFQQRHSLSANGELDDATRELLNEYFAEQTGRTAAPEGILRAPGVRQAVERRICDRGMGNRPFCPQDREAIEVAGDRGTETTRPDDDKELDEKAEDKKDDHANRQQKARQAIAGAERGITYVQNAMDNVPRNVNTSQMRRALAEAEAELGTARRAYRAEEYGMAYESAVAARQLAARALEMLPEQARDRERVREAVESFERLEREERDQDKKDELRACGLEKFRDLVGQRIADRQGVIDRWEEHHGERAGTRSVRFLNPGDAMTMDYIETRLNVFLDRAGAVEKVTCG